MVLQEHPDLTADAATQGEAVGGSNDDLEVEPVATLRGDASREDPVSPAVRVERLRRLALQIRVVSLEEKLERKDQQLRQVREQYESALGHHGTGSECVVGTWPGDDEA